jgi:hypothetical protein
MSSEILQTVPPVSAGVPVARAKQRRIETIAARRIRASWRAVQNDLRGGTKSVWAHLIFCAVAERLYEVSRGLEPTELGSQKATRRGATPEPNANQAVQASLRDARLLRSLPMGFKPTAYRYPRVIHRSEESPQELVPAASVNNSAAQKVLGKLFGNRSADQE